MQTRLFHTVVVVGSGLLAGCPKSNEAPPPAAGSSIASHDAPAAPPDAPVMLDAPPRPVLIDAAVAAPIDAPVKKVAPKPQKLRHPPLPPIIQTNQ